MLMARIKEFDPEEVLGRAMELFWRQGYAATSIADLVEHLGIARASLYATFGGKHDLYLAALDRYINDTGSSPVETLSGSGPVLSAIQSLLDSYAAPPLAGRPPGCMVVKAAVECPVDDVAVHRRLDLNWGSIEVLLTSALLRARALGEVRADVDPASSAQFLLVLMQGMQVVSGSEGGAQRAAAAARHALDALR